MPHYDLLHNLPDTEGAIYTASRPDVPPQCSSALAVVQHGPPVPSRPYPVLVSTKV